jgi:fatty-acid desaturase/outer membrane receptor protein involved in Fe transport
MPDSSLAGAAAWVNAHALLPQLPVWAYALLTVLDTHITSACVTLYLHRAQTHRSIAFHPVVEHVMRFWLWVRTAMPTKEWVAVHRCHHAHVDTAEDPHSPIFFGIWRVVLFGTALYHAAAHDEDVVRQYGKGTPDDLLERRIYTPLSLLGPVVTLGSNALIFGVWGVAMWLVEMAWIPFFAAGVINGLGHWWGYRNFETPDHSRNLPGRYWSLLTCGEALHNNHHHIQNSPRFAMRPGELDPGYWYFRLLQMLRLARTRQDHQAIAAVVAFFVLLSGPAWAQTPEAEQPPPEPVQFKEAVEVVGVTPIHGLGLAISKVPSNVQVATASDVGRAPGTPVSDIMASSFASVNANETQSNPFQPDIQFRGFAVSPLLGLAQGIAVYQDGVRVNEPFGDTVNWDILPSSAIAGINLMPGSNPLFGLNALGGALSIETKSGFVHDGHSVQLLGGSFGRLLADVQSGGHSDRLSYYVTGRLLHEDGWRDFSPSKVRQFFGKAEWRDGPTSVGVSLTGGANRLIGNGPAPVELLEIDRAAIFTHEDRTETRVALLNVNARRTASDRLTIEAMGFFRPATVETFNGDDTNYTRCRNSAIRNFLCADRDAPSPVLDQFGRPISIDGGPYEGTNHTSLTETRGWGGALQATLTAPLAGRENHFIVGANADLARSRYAADTEIAHLTSDRGTAGIGLFDAQAAVDIRTTSNQAGFHLADFLSVTPRVTLTGSARFTYSAIRLRDQIGDDLTGDHDFMRVNPAAGATFQLSAPLALFGSYSESSRVPTPSELSCADEDDPCRLPNAFVSDPPLEQVVARTLEGGLRGRASGVTWSAAAFRTRNSNDILFISSGQLTNEGHFENVGDTLRQGFELLAYGTLGSRIRWNGTYTHLRATFDTPLVVSSPNHPEAEDGEIAVAVGSRLPSLPRHTWKVDLSYSTARASVDTNVVYNSSQFFRGDEANLMEPIDGSLVVNLGGRYAIHKNLALSARLSNLFDAEYSTFGLLGEADDVLGDEFEDVRFVSPGAPRAAWIGLEISFR